MFEKIKKKVKGLVHKVKGQTTIIEALGVSPATSTKMRKAHKNIDIRYKWGIIKKMIEPQRPQSVMYITICQKSIKNRF